MGKLNNKNGRGSDTRGSDAEVELTTGEIWENRLWAFGVCCALFVVLPLVIGVALNYSAVRHFTEPSAPCTNLTCATTMLLRPDADTTFCVDSVCTTETDARTCCLFKAACTSLACPSGHVQTLRYSSLRCQGAACSLEADLSTCCDPMGTCQGAACPEHFAVAPDAVGRQCRHSWCEESECCSATCAAVGCGTGRLSAYAPVANAAERFCNDPRHCVSDQYASPTDVESCCVAMCIDFYGDCPENFEQLDYDESERVACANFDCTDPSDTQTCCKESDWQTETAIM